MDAIELLTSDHDAVRDLFERFRSAKESSDTDKMKATQAEIFQELETHTRIEEEVFYPAVRERGGEDLAETVDEGRQEHHVVTVLMREIESLKDQNTYEAKMTVLMENVEHHADEEESEMFPQVRSLFSAEELDDLGEELQAAKS